MPCPSSAQTVADPVPGFRSQTATGEAPGANGSDADQLTGNTVVIQIARGAGDQLQVILVVRVVNKK
jgi:hypothetical protein